MNEEWVSVSPRYTLSDQLSYGSVLYVFMSVNIAERPTLEKRAVHFDRGVFV